jgi:hypothetical protein
VPVFTASNIHYDVAAKTRAIALGGIGAVQLLVRKLGLAEAIEDRLHLLKYHLPYHESDHVLNLAYNALCNGTCLDDIELRRNRPGNRPSHEGAAELLDLTNLARRARAFVGRPSPYGLMPLEPVSRCRPLIAPDTQ